MNELEIFYNDHFKTSDMPDWSELDVGQKMILKKSSSFAGYRLGIAAKSIRMGFPPPISEKEITTAVIALANAMNSISINISESMKRARELQKKCKK